MLRPPLQQTRVSTRRRHTTPHCPPSSSPCAPPTLNAAPPHPTSQDLSDADRELVDGMVDEAKKISR